MHIQRLSLTNFKCFERGEIDLAKITLVLGANSAGKSSLLYGILAALQSDQFPLSLSLNGDLAELGDFHSISHRRRLTQDVGIEIEFGGHKLGEVTLGGQFSYSRRSHIPELAAAEVHDPAFQIDIRRKTTTATKSPTFQGTWNYAHEKDVFMSELNASEELRSFFRALGRMMTKDRKSDSPAQMELTETPAEFSFEVPPPKGSFSLSSPRDIFNRLANPKYVLFSPHLGALTTVVSEFRQKFNFIGSFRLEPKRTYLQKSLTDLRVERDGNNYIDQLAKWQIEQSPLLGKLHTALNRLKLLTNIRASRRIGGLFDIRVRSDSRNVPVSLADVGFGVGQVLPILVADFQLEKGGTLAVSQPEIHLHPSVQADLAEHFVQRSATAGSRYIIETHSEYFLNRIRLLVSRGELAQSDLSVVYLTNDGTSSRIHKITFGLDGRIEGAPKEFFDTYMVDVMNIALAARE